MFRAFALSIFLAFAGLTGFSQTAISDTLMADENYKLFQSGTLTRDSLISIYCSSAEDAQENHDFTASRVLLKKAEKRSFAIYFASQSYDTFLVLLPPILPTFIKVI